MLTVMLPSHRTHRRDVCPRRPFSAVMAVKPHDRISGNLTPTKGRGRPRKYEPQRAKACMRETQEKGWQTDQGTSACSGASARRTHLDRRGTVNDSHVWWKTS